MGKPWYLTTQQQVQAQYRLDNLESRTNKFKLLVKVGESGG